MNPFMIAADEPVLTAQLGRTPRGPWRVAVRCPHGRPRVIASPSRLSDGAPFPTTFWLTCPLLVEAVNDVESEGGVALWEERLSANPLLRLRERAAAGAYIAFRQMESGGSDACAGVGVAGIADPIGEGVAVQLPDACDDERCRELELLWKDLGR